MPLIRVELPGNGTAGHSLILETEWETPDGLARVLQREGLGEADDTAGHKMHAEWGEVPAVTAQAVAETRARGGRVVSIGTTALRLLETVARDHDGAVTAWTGETDIFITPGFRFRAVDLLLTNFHLPRSTLFMLVAAFAGLENMKAAYAHAVRERYRFYSYGDCCLLRR